MEQVANPSTKAPFDVTNFEQLARRQGFYVPPRHESFPNAYPPQAGPSARPVPSTSVPAPLQHLPSHSWQCKSAAEAVVPQKADLQASLILPQTQRTDRPCQRQVVASISFSAQSLPRRRHHRNNTSTMRYPSTMRYHPSRRNRAPPQSQVALISCCARNSSKSSKTSAWSHLRRSLRQQASTPR